MQVQLACLIAHFEVNLSPITLSLIGATRALLAVVRHLTVGQVSMSCLVLTLAFYVELMPTQRAERVNLLNQACLVTVYPPLFE
ncbi:hypothetical protein METHB2_340034 [Candidatus Methylobacter favarea]|uniref:Uncharacterized protein n=1 Tax=Candidatus Methylobacter favarea TaxID=2707345 RepID=A0A8S0XIW8_9GAMM|nr:hypothetical protein METHB2_340034 [Candidatus Methylobacter favarea]